MVRTRIISDSLYTPLGKSADDVFAKIRLGQSGVKMISLGNETLPLAVLDSSFLLEGCTRFDSLCRTVLDNLFSKIEIDRSKTLLLLSTTKGNIELLDGDINDERVSLYYSANKLKERYKLQNALVVSNACISGIMALAVAKRYLDSKLYQNVIVLAADVLTNFVVKGFQSVQAMSDENCKPFDHLRKGINLGEGAAAVLLSNVDDRHENNDGFELAGCSITNDANHISGPSRSGEELGAAITLAMHDANIQKQEIGFICLHGTATIYNDEMESKAVYHADLLSKPVNSLKGYFGHTLGAAGLIETIVCTQSLKHQELAVSFGYESSGTSVPLNVIIKNEKINTTSFVKTASGFGGGNAAIVVRY